MKKIFLIIALVFTSAFSFGQTMFDSLENLEDVDVVVVNKDAFEILSKIKINSKDKEALEVFSMIQNLEELKVFSTESLSIADQMESLVKKSVSKYNLTELMRVKDKDSRVKIYVESSKNKDLVSKVLMFVKEKKRGNNKPESIIISLTGDIDINKISKLADTYTKE